ncbi:hypothetical protein DSL72_002667 [Monilinia vaccinii-corymbosi]|uniref:Uncharacterized protein n=1 Tax=Monilinia vaccinii-corymbosi TaxID=61207 RepID=A0A8A3PD35_9HELO|nr:hypothetical protein DSL72_002667 [Monilinia vaccinii-corymbosi]
MSGMGHFDFVANGDKRVIKGGVTVHQDGTEEAKREKKGLGNIPLDAPPNSVDGVNAESADDSYQRISGSAYDAKSDVPRAQSFPMKGKSKKPGVFGSLKKLIIRPKSEQDTAATGGHKSPIQSNCATQGINKSHTVTGSFQGDKKAEGQGEHGSFSVLKDGRRIDNATGYEIITVDGFCQLHFNGVGAGPGAPEPAISNATSAPIDIPQNLRRKEESAEWIARSYIEELPSSPYSGEGEIPSSKHSHYGRKVFTDSHHAHARSDSDTSERWSHDTHPSRSYNMSLEPEFSRPEEELMERVISTSDGGMVNITPHNVDNVLAIWKGSFGTSSSSSSSHIPPRHHALDYPGRSKSIEALPMAISRPARLRELEPQGLTASLPDTPGLEERAVKAHWAQENILGKLPPVPSAPSPLQQTTNLGEPSRPRNILKRNNTTMEAPVRGWGFPNRSHAGDVPHSRHPLANEITLSQTLGTPTPTQTRNRPVLQAIQEPPHETIPGPRYSTIPASPPPSFQPARSEHGHQSPRMWNRKVTPVTKPSSRPNLSAWDQVSPTIDRSSAMTTISQFIPSQDEEVEKEGTAWETSTKVSRQRMGSPNAQNFMRENPVPEVPTIPKIYAKRTSVLPKISRGANGRFSVENIEHGQAELAFSSGDDGVEVGGEILGEEEAPQEVSVALYKNHTIGTWDAALRKSPPEVSPLSSVEDLDDFPSPISLLGERRDGWGEWRDHEKGGENIFWSPEPYQEESDFISDTSPPSYPPTFAPSHRPAAAPTHHPPQPPPQPPPPPFPTSRPPLNQARLFQHQPPPRSPTLPHSQQAPPRISTFDPTIPVTRPLHIRKKKIIRPQDSFHSVEEDARAIQRREGFMGGRV